MSSNLASLQRISDLVEEYNLKLASVLDNIAAYDKACQDLQSCLTISGQYGESFSFTSIYDSKAKASLLKSAWRKVYNGLNIEKFSSAKDRKDFQQNLESNLPDFTLDNIRATFGDYIMNPRKNILRALAEVFCSLDPYYKSHNKIKFGSEKMPKRVVFSNVTSTYGWGYDRLQDTLRALFTYQERRQLEYNEMSELLKNGASFKGSHGIELKRFKNGNAHLHFDKGTIKDINSALAEYYGEVLPDTPEEADKPQQSTAISKDLQYYPTPISVVERLLGGHSWKGKKVLEPSCGCGRIMIGLRECGAIVNGIEYDSARAEQARARGFNVLKKNFLETVPQPIYDAVVMNPPFYGKHYFKHIEHARKFLTNAGVLIAILPVSARYDHGSIKDGQWNDLPVGAFSESGTNINTTILTIRKSNY